MNCPAAVARILDEVLKTDKNDRISTTVREGRAEEIITIFQVQPVELPNDGRCFLSYVELLQGERQLKFLRLYRLQPDKDAPGSDALLTIRGGGRMTGVWTASFGNGYVDDLVVNFDGYTRLSMLDLPSLGLFGYMTKFSMYIAGVLAKEAVTREQWCDGFGGELQ